jgi:hypothetical protein
MDFWSRCIQTSWISLSGDLFSKSVNICSAKLKTFSDPDDLVYRYLAFDLQRAGKPVPTHDEIARFKTDPLLALQFIDVWEHLRPEISDYAPVQELFRLWLDLQKKLSRIGLNLSTEELLRTYPEVLIEQIRSLNTDDLVRNRLAYDEAESQRNIEDAKQTVQAIYFFTLSRFNDDAREATRQKPNESLYVKLVRSFILERNARIVTFNYDTMLDEAIFMHFTRSWKYGGVKVAGINGYPVAKGIPADLSLIKPHGSLNYLVCRNCQRAHVNWFWSYRYTGANTPSVGNRRCTVCTEPSAGRPELMGSLTVAPLYDKKLIEKSYKAIKKAFAWADQVVSVGYSFPDQDTYV